MQKDGPGTFKGVSAVRDRPRNVLDLQRLGDPTAQGNVWSWVRSFGRTALGQLVNRV